MDYKNRIKTYKNFVSEQVANLDEESINELLNLLVNARTLDKQIFIMGNGGSGATASHFVGDFNKGLSLGKPREERYRVICLNDNTSTVLSLANDVSYEDIFVEQLKNFLCPGDVVIGLSGSGNSKNVLRAASFAKEHGNTLVGLTGYDGGRLKELADINIHIPIHNMQVVEDLHMILTHLMFWVLKQD